MARKTQALFSNALNMKSSYSSIAVLMVLLFFSGCGKQYIYEVIASSPQGAYIYWGKSESKMVQTPYTTLNSRFMEGDQWESWCYQVRKPGYLPSEIVCRPDGDENRTINFKLIKIKTSITSYPPNAEIYWGESRDELWNTHQSTPHTEEGENNKASYSNWYFQVRLAGYKDSEITFMPLAQEDRRIHFVLEPIE